MERACYNKAIDDKGVNKSYKFIKGRKDILVLSLTRISRQILIFSKLNMSNQTLNW